MIEIAILYPHAPGRRFDHDYYENTHIPMALDLLGPSVREVIVARGIAPGPPWSDPIYSATCRFLCDSIEAYMQALLPGLSRLQADLVNYSDVEPIIQISEVRVTHRPPAGDASA
jgi:uncharacterized protein (TIGR02118 family)